MESKGAFFWFSCTLIFLLLSCVDPYEPPAIQANNSFLVVEGFINTGEGPTEFTLSRTARLADTAQIKAERGAEVSIEEKNSDKILRLVEKAGGIYAIDQYDFNEADEYRLRIKTTGGKIYLSDFVPIQKAPAIDSLSWRKKGNEIEVYVNTHDPQAKTRYYRWDYEETWKFNSAYVSSLKYDPEENILVPRNPDSLNFYCWQSSQSSTINLGSSAKLEQDIIYLQPLEKISPNAWKLSLTYSILVKQYALNKEAYLYFQQMKKNSEQLGSFFDPQPVEVDGNIRCTTNPEEPVIGYLFASSVDEERMYINRKDVPGWNSWSYSSVCSMIEVSPDSVGYFFGSGLYLPLYEDILINKYKGATAFCADCTLRGTTKKPDFWE